MNGTIQPTPDPKRKCRLLFVIEGDPRSNPRPAEAVRIAAGITSLRKVEVLIYLHDLAVRCLAETADDLVDGDNYTRYLPGLVEETAHPIYVQKEAPALAEIGRSPVRWLELDNAELAELAAQSDYLAHFS